VFNPRLVWSIVVIVVTKSVTCTPTALANAVGINRGSSTTNTRTDRSTFPSASGSANCGSSARSYCGGQFVAVLLPEATSMPVPVTNTTRVGVRIVSMSVSQSTARSTKRRRCNQ
jgi:hypothetical protein